MKVFAAVFVVAMMLLPTEGSEEDGEHFIMYGPHGEYVDENTPFFYINDDYGVPQKAYTSEPNVSFAIPQMMLRSQVRFHLYTRDNDDTTQEHRLFVGEHHTLKSSRFDPRMPVKVLVHGFGNTIKSETIQNPMKAYLESGYYNVIGVDWGDNCQLPFYRFAKGNTIQVGQYIAELLTYLVETAGVQPENIHIIGHSLGAHVSGIAGYSLHNFRVGRITGLDPAGPFFSDTPEEEKLDPTDAHFVDVIHTCGGSLGLMGTVGMADFYPNGGVNIQPGCENEYFFNRPPCSHSKAHHLWTESVRVPDKFPAHHCHSVEEAEMKACIGPVETFMGDGADPRTYGVFGLRTQ